MNLLLLLRCFAIPGWGGRHAVKMPLFFDAHSGSCTLASYSLHNFAHMDRRGGPLLRLSWARDPQCLHSSADEPVEPCALRLALPRWSRALHNSSILAIVSFLRSHLGQPISGESPRQGFVSYPTHAGRTLSICKQACSALLTTCFLAPGILHLSKVIFLPFVENL
ncbi:hypothetical protein V8C35DRAFT_100855 [Trichoderma chlorosporum]